MYKYKTKIFRGDISCAISFYCVFLIQTYARPEATAAGHAQYAANITGKILKFYENHFDIEYSQQKLGKTFLDIVE